MKNNNCCYVGTVKEFLSKKTIRKHWIEEMKKQFVNVYPSFNLQESEVASWEDTFDVLQTALSGITCKNTTYIVFEYKLPEEGGRRPDVLLINSSQIFVLEFKRKGNYDDTNLDQVISYARDLSEYHEKSRTMSIHPYLILTLARGIEKQKKGNVWVLSPDQLSSHLKTLQSAKDFNITDWLEAKYEPLPSILQNVIRLKDEAKEKYPDIFQIRNTNIPKLEKKLNDLVLKAQQDKKIILVCLTGDPGTGKTLLGLKLVYNQIYQHAIYVTASRSLTKILQKELGNETYIRPITKLKEMDSVNHHIIVIDEAQRVWDDSNEHGVNKNDIIRLMDNNEWGVLLIICAEGQVIRYKEHEDFTGWQIAISKVDPKNNKWEIICPPQFAKDFKDNSSYIEPKLNLTVSLRARKGQGVISFVNALLNRQFIKAKENLDKIDDSFPIYVTRSLKSAKIYCESRFGKNKDKRYGLLTSSKNALSIYEKIYSAYEKWYLSKKGEEGSSQNLITKATEFDCQGLELDLPIVCWGMDLTYHFIPITEENYYQYMSNEDIPRNALDWYFDMEVHIEDPDPINYDDDLSPVDEDKCFKRSVYMYDEVTNDYYKSLVTAPNETNSEFTDQIIDNYKDVCKNRLIEGMDLRVKYRLADGEKSLFYSTDFKEWRGYFYGCCYPQFSMGDMDFKNYSQDYPSSDPYYEKTQYISNIYRVLLTRGRDGMILYIPETEDLDDTYLLFKTLGVKELHIDED